DLVVAGEAGAHLFVGGVRREAGGVADRCREDARRLPELALGSPEAAEAEYRHLEPRRERRRERMTVHVVSGRHRHAFGPARKRPAPVAPRPRPLCSGRLSLLGRSSGAPRSRRLPARRATQEAPHTRPRPPARGAPAATAGRRELESVPPPSENHTCDLY